jgi:hypothetical protein
MTAGSLCGFAYELLLTENIQARKLAGHPEEQVSSAYENLDS